MLILIMVKRKRGMKISNHITYAEAIHSNTAKRRGIDNTPSQTQVEAMKLLAEKVFESGKAAQSYSMKTDRGAILRKVDIKVFSHRFGYPSVGITRANLHQILIYVFQGNKQYQFLNSSLLSLKTLCF